MTLNSPSNIEILIHCHCCPRPHPRLDAPAIHETIVNFIEDGIIYQDPEMPNVYRTTPKGQAWLKVLCNTPCPTQAFIDEQGRVIKLP